MKIIKVLNLLNPFNFIKVIKAIYRLSLQSTHTELLNNILTNESIFSFLEVGVNEGANLFKLAKNNQNVRFYGVDPYYSSESEILEPVFGIHKTIYSNDKYSQMLNRLQKLRLNNIELIKKTSINASKDFTDLSLDFIFIDGLHSYTNV